MWGERDSPNVDARQIRGADASVAHREAAGGLGRSLQLKLDGYRALAIKTGGKVQLRSRNDNEFSLDTRRSAR
jgi:ATP-dependent DNA ligase